ncbi:MAG: NAD-dependent DNA ligase LigA [Clostridiales bacterium]|nr:NAD-dependent DNA ligase LigA [Clostridiales bacterium]MDY3747339.1 NAD-dependent DNA ligase LigA [Lachnospiraceae bacterium]
MQNKLERMKELVEVLNEASKAYYQEDREVMSNLEYDRLYDELLSLESETNTVLSNSPTIHVGYEVLSELPKEAHESPMLSLDKTKDSDALKSWLGSHSGLLSWKMDGLTIVLTYRDGSLAKAVTRGNGIVGEVITGNARMFKNIPHKIAFTGELIIRGEAVIKYSDFNEINSRIEDVDAKYKNPRNLCSGSVRQLNNEITKKRNVHFFAFSLVKADDVDFSNSRMNQMEWLKSLGFDVVEYTAVTGENIKEVVENFAKRITDNDFPSDGLVLTLDDIAYSRQLGATAKFPRDSIAFKWADELKETVLREIQWSASRTGLINPIAVFDPVELEGTTVSRASVHNLSIVEALQLGVGDKIEVYKANMIIPQIAENLTRSGNLHIPDQCPVCGGKTSVRQTNDVKSLYCTNPDCQAKKIKAFSLFVSRDAMNIEGLSEATLEKFIQCGFIKNFSDIFKIYEHKDAIITMEGFGEKSFKNLMDSIERARSVEIDHFVYSLGILNIGLSNARLICRAFDNDFEKVRKAKSEQLVAINGIGQVIADSFESFFADEENNRLVDALLKEIHLTKKEENENSRLLDGKIFVITGSVTHFQNRNALKAYIEERGGKVTGSVSANTSFLINNDAQSSSSKNKKAKSLNIPIITEDEFIAMCGSI